MLVCSFPKCGRTWLRFMLAHYLREAFKIDVAIDMRTCYLLAPNLDLAAGGPTGHRPYLRDGLPLFTFTHDRPENLEWLLAALEVLTGDPRDGLASCRIVFLVRDIRDLVVSLFFEHHARQGGKHAGDDEESKRVLKENVRREVPAHISYLNRWAEVLADHREADRVIASYEEMHADPGRLLSRVLELSGLSVDRALVAASVERSTLPRMQEAERGTDVFGGAVPLDNPGAFRAREGAIGGHVKHLDGEDLAFIAAECEASLSAAAKQLLAARGLRYAG